MTETRVDPDHIDEPYLHVVAAILWHRQDDGRLLIAQRQQGKHLAEHWELPGGKLESGESPWQGLQRELYEEIGIQATRGQPFMKVYHRYPERISCSIPGWSTNITARSGPGSGSRLSG